MDNHTPPKPANLLNDLESIRQLLDQEQLEPPLLTDSIDPSAIPLLSDIVSPPTVRKPAPSSPPPAATPPTPAPATPAATSSLSATLQRSLRPSALELNRLDGEMRAAAQLMLQDVIDDFVPQIEAELKRRLEARLDRLLSQRKP